MNCPACGQDTPTMMLDGSTYLENHVENLTWSSIPYWLDDTHATFTVSTRLCPASGREVDTQT